MAYVKIRLARGTSKYRHLYLPDNGTGYLAGDDTFIRLAHGKVKSEKEGPGGPDNYRCRTIPVLCFLSPFLRGLSADTGFSYPICR